MLNPLTYDFFLTYDRHTYFIKDLLENTKILGISTSTFALNYNKSTIQFVFTKMK